MVLASCQMNHNELNCFRLLKRDSGPEIVDFWGLNGLLLPQNPLEKVGAKPPTFSSWAFRSV